MRRSNLCGRKAIPVRVITGLGQVSENSAHPPPKQSCHVLHEDELRSYHANATHHLPPESRTGAGNSGALAGVADVLAGESSSDDAEIFGEAGAAESEREAADPGEEMDLRVAEELFVRYGFDVSFIHDTFGQKPFFDSLPEHRRAIGVVLVVEMSHRKSLYWCWARAAALFSQTTSVRV